MRLLTRDKSFYRTLVALAVPVALQNLITFGVNLADNLMVGSLGDASVSGVYMGSQLQTFLQLFSGGIEGAMLILAAQYWGKRDIGSIKRIAALGVQFSLGFGLLMTVAGLIFPGQIISVFTSDKAVIAEGVKYLRIVCLSYTFFCLTQSLIASMRSVEVARIGTLVSSISLVFNIVLNYVLIFGKLGLPAMGVRGAALATLISRMVETCVIGIYVARFDTKLRIRFRDLLVSDPLLRRDLIRYGLPILGGNVVWSVNMMTNSAILGHLNNAAAVVTAAGMANQLHSLCYVAMTGASTAVGIITGKTVGAGKRELMKEYARTVQILFLGLGLISGALVIGLRYPFISLYTGVSGDAAAFAAQFIAVLAVSIVGTSYQAAGLFGLVKSGGDISFVFINDTIFVFGVVLPSAFLAAHFGAPAWVVWACLKCDQVLKCFVAVVKINRFRWMKDLTRNRPAEN